jgi:hypothetical protein
MTCTLEQQTALLHKMEAVQIGTVPKPVSVDLALSLVGLSVLTLLAAQKLS